MLYRSYTFLLILCLVVLSITKQKRAAVSSCGHRWVWFLQFSLCCFEILSDGSTFGMLTSSWIFCHCERLLIPSGQEDKSVLIPVNPFVSGSRQKPCVTSAVLVTITGKESHPRELGLRQWWENLGCGQGLSNSGPSLVPLGVIAVVIFTILCTLVFLIRYMFRHKGTYHTNEAKGAESAESADAAIMNNDPNFTETIDESKKEWLIWGVAF